MLGGDLPAPADQAVLGIAAFCPDRWLDTAQGGRIQPEAVFVIQDFAGRELDWKLINTLSLARDAFRFYLDRPESLLHFVWDSPRPAAVYIAIPKYAGDRSDHLIVGIAEGYGHAGIFDRMLLLICHTYDGFDGLPHFDLRTFRWIEQADIQCCHLRRYLRYRLDRCGGSAAACQ